MTKKEDDEEELRKKRKKSNTARIYSNIMIRSFAVLLIFHHKNLSYSTSYFTSSLISEKVKLDQVILSTWSYKAQLFKGNYQEIITCL